VARTGAQPAVVAEVTLTRRGARSAAARVLLRDAAGRVVARLEEAVFQRIALPGAATTRRAAAHIELIPAAEGPPPPPALLPALAAAQGAAAALDLSEAALLLEAHVAAAAQEVPLLAAAPEAAAYLAFLRLSLVEDGAAEAGPASFRLLPDGALPPAAEIWRSVLAEHPELALDLAWIAEAAERLPEALRGARRAAAPPPLAGAALGRLAETLAAAVGAFAAAWPESAAAAHASSRRGRATCWPPASSRRRSPRLGRRVRYVAAGRGAHRAARAAARSRPAQFRPVAWDPRGAGATADARRPRHRPRAPARLRRGRRWRRRCAGAGRGRRAAAGGAAARPRLDLRLRPGPGWWTGLGPIVRRSEGGRAAGCGAVARAARARPASARAWRSAGLRALARRAGRRGSAAAAGRRAARPGRRTGSSASPRRALPRRSPPLPAPAGGAQPCRSARRRPPRLKGARVVVRPAPRRRGPAATLPPWSRLADRPRGSAGLRRRRAGGAQPRRGARTAGAAAVLGLMRVLATRCGGAAPGAASTCPPHLRARGRVPRRLAGRARRGGAGA
jgi:hypothetical protein